MNPILLNTPVATRTAEIASETFVRLLNPSKKDAEAAETTGNFLRVLILKAARQAQAEWDLRRLTDAGEYIPHTVKHE